MMIFFQPEAKDENTIHISAVLLSLFLSLVFSFVSLKSYITHVGCSEQWIDFEITDPVDEKLTD